MSSGPTAASALAGPTSARPIRARAGRLLAAGLVSGIAVAGLAATTGASAGAAAPLRAQAVGRFVDGTVGSKSLESLADVHDARATAPGQQSVQNPLDVTLLGQLNLPLTGVINLPTSPAVVAGAVNQVANAHLDGSSLGAAGAVSNQGGIEVGGANGPVPAVATINLSASALPKTPLDLPGAGEASALGGVTGSVGAVTAIATTKAGGAVSPAPKYNIAGLKLTLASPALGNVLAQLGGLLNPAGLPGLPGTPISLPGVTVPGPCTFQTAVLAPISFAGGGVTIDPTGGAVTLDLAKLLASAGANINALPANTDLVAWLVNYLTSPKGLAAGVQNVLTSIVKPGQDRLTNCLTAIGKENAAAQLLLDPLVKLINTGSSELTQAVTTLTTALGAAAGGSSPLAPLGTALKSLIDIGVNVESGPGIQPTQNDPAYRFTTKLAKTPNQATAVVPDQTLVRALEINVLPAAGGSGVATVALANAAVGPSSIAAPSSGGLGVEAASTQLPTGVPAGSARPTGTPTVPLALLGVGLLMAGAGAVAWKVRGRHV
jgi:hypothetical protein